MTVSVQDLGLDSGIAEVVRVLREAGIETSNRAKAAKATPTLCLPCDSTEMTRKVSGAWRWRWRRNCPWRNCGACGSCKMKNLPARGGS